MNKKNYSFSLTAILFSMLTFLSVQTPAQTANSVIKGLRVDPSYFYGSHSGQSVSAVANDVVSKAKATGTNTLFLYAYNSVYGAWYPTTYSQSAVEGGYGKSNIFKEITTVAKNNGIKVVAVVPVNNFRTVWTNNPAWRVKTKGGADYKPFADVYQLSAHNQDFKNWLKGLYQDLLARNPDIDGIEAVEPTVDYYWRKEVDYSAAANNAYKAKYPSGTLGDANWVSFRAQGMTDLIQILTSTANAAGKKSYLVQTLPAKPDGTLHPLSILRDNIGLDLDGIMAMPTNKLNYVMAELIWQQWAADYGPTKFNPSTWTRSATQAFKTLVGSRAIPIAHFEISTFVGAYTTVTPTLAEFQASVDSVKDLNIGVDVYDFEQIRKANAWTQLSVWKNYTGTETVPPTPSPEPAPAPSPTPAVMCPSITRTFASAPNSAGKTQTCSATLPKSAPSSTPVQATVTNGGNYSVKCEASGWWSGTVSTIYCPPPGTTAPAPAPTPAPAPSPSPSPTPASNQVYGLTIDQIGNLNSIVTSLKSLSQKPTTRIVFDENVAASYYANAASQIHAVSYVMGEILDSFYVKDISVSGYSARTTEYMNTLGSNVDIWEIGNEINGEWLGSTSDVVTKMTNAYNIVKNAGKKTALTLYYNEDCWMYPANEMFTWANKNVPASMKSGLDYVWISYYEDDCNNLQPNWPAVYQKLAAMFPNSKIGFGEVGTNVSSKKASYINRYYNMTINQPNYVGGYFWWYGFQDFVPMTNPLWTTFNDAIKN